MANDKFDSKSFNPQAFKYLKDRVPNLKMNELKKSRALTGNPDIRATLAGQDGAGYARLAMRGLIDGDAVNYDGQTDIEATSTKTFERGVVVVGRAKAWIERDFSYDITGGEDFMANIAAQVAEYLDGVDQDTLLAILKGIFSMTGTKNLEFVDKHTYDVTGTGAGIMAATTLNTAVNKACGANKKKFALVFMHSDVATGLENLNLIEHLKYTDKDGVTRSLEMGTWNGKLVIVDDGLPVTMANPVYGKTADTALTNGKAYYTRSGTAGKYAYTTVEAPDVANIGTYYEVTGEGEPVYTTYVLGNGAIDYEDLGVKVPNEMSRDPKTNGGQDTLYTRQRKVFAPFGLSYEKVSQATISPTEEELADGTNWALVNTGEPGEADRSYINHKAIPIARILSKG